MSWGGALVTTSGGSLVTTPVPASLRDNKPLSLYFLKKQQEEEKVAAFIRKGLKAQVGENGTTRYVRLLGKGKCSCSDRLVDLYKYWSEGDHSGKCDRCFCSYRSDIIYRTNQQEIRDFGIKWQNHVKEAYLY